MSPRTSLRFFKAQFLACVIFGQVALANATETVLVDGRSYSLETPPGVCEASETVWGRAYHRFLSQLGAGAGGDPQILLVFSDCEFRSGAGVAGRPARWGYLAYDANVNKYWFGQRSLNKRLRELLGKDIEGQGMARELRRLTDNSLSKMKSRIKIGEIVPLGKPFETNHGFLASALTRLENGNSHLDVYLVTVTFIRNREILTLTLYAPAEFTGALEGIMASGKQFLTSLEG